MGLIVAVAGLIAAALTYVAADYWKGLVFDHDDVWFMTVVFTAMAGFMWFFTFVAFQGMA